MDHGGDEGLGVTAAFLGTGENHRVAFDASDQVRMVAVLAAGERMDVAIRLPGRDLAEEGLLFAGCHEQSPFGADDSTRSTIVNSR